MKTKSHQTLALSLNYKKEFIFFLALLFLTLCSRLLPHLANITSVGGLFIFAGAFVKPRTLSFALPVVALMISDLIIGLHGTLFYVYGGFLFMGFLSMFMSSHMGSSRLKRHSILALISITATLSFFFISNFGVWHMESLYSKDLNGLINCYLMGLPFLYRQLWADFFFVQAFALVFSFYKSYAASAQAHS